MVVSAINKVPFLCGRFVKRLVDPDKIELLTTPQEKAGFVQQLHHNYLAVYNNIKQLPPWFSDEACKAITGVGSSKRRLYSDDEDIIYDYKRCIMISSINNSLTEPDALDRSILTQFDRIADEQRREESEVEVLFEEMRPKLWIYFRYIGQDVAIQAQYKINQPSKNGRLCSMG